jgi:hypothetical protein
MTKTVKKIRKTKKKKKSVWLRRVVGINLFLVLSSLFVYIGIGLFYDSQFFGRDLSDKFGIIAGSSNTTLSVKIIGPPEKPEVTASPMCNGASPYVKLTWNTTLDTDYYDIDRDGSPLVAGVVGTSYDDYAVNYSTPYGYLVTAFGPLGNTASDPVSATTLSECNVLPPPTCNITKFDKINLAGYVGIPKTDNAKPTTYGTTNMPDALIGIVITGKSTVLAATQASSTGYWSWKPLHDLHSGSYHMFTTAIDISDPSRYASATLDFKINEVEEKEEEHKKREEKETPEPIITPTKPAPPAPTKEEIESFRLSVKVKNTDNAVYTGRDLKLKVNISHTDKFPHQEQELHYYITDSNGKIVAENTDKVFIDKDMDVDKSIGISKLVKPGRYNIAVESNYGDALITADHVFFVKEMPVVSIGSGISFTLTDIMSRLSWIIIGLALLLLIFILLLIMEHLIYERSLIHITEQNLRDKGLLGKRKGVSR